MTPTSVHETLTAARPCGHVKSSSSYTVTPASTQAVSVSTSLSMFFIAVISRTIPSRIIAKPEYLNSLSCVNHSFIKKYIFQATITGKAQRRISFEMFAHQSMLWVLNVHSFRTHNGLPFSLRIEYESRVPILWKLPRDLIKAPSMWCILGAKTKNLSG